MAYMYPSEKDRLVDFLDALKKFGDLKLKAVNEEMQKVFQELALNRHAMNMYEKTANEKPEDRVMTEAQFMEIVKLMALFEKATALILANYDTFTRLNNDAQIVSKVMKIIYGRAEKTHI